MYRWKNIVTAAMGGVAFAAGAIPAVAAPADHGLGYVAPKTTQAVKAADVSTASDSTPPSSFDLRKWAVAPGDQGNHNSCVGWTVGRDLAGWLANFRGKSVTEFAPMYVYSQVNLGKDQGIDNGAYPVDAIKLVISQGIDTAKDYWQGYDDWQDQPTQAEKNNAAQYKSQLLSKYSVIFSNAQGHGGSDLKDALKSAIYNYNPVIIGMTARKSLKAVNSNTGVYDDTTGEILGGHAVLAVGYTPDGLIIENHWGQNWGTNGYALLSWRVIEQDVLEADVAR
jgi:C1A family cysteine protease